MLSKAIFHIGAPKTGTSIVQSHLSQNRRVLRDKGVFYPVTISPHKHLYRTFESHHLLTYAVAGWEPFNLFEPQRFMRWARRRCERHGMHTLLLSAENAYWLPHKVVLERDFGADEYFSAKEEFLTRLRGLLEGLECRLVVYLRRQDRWIESWYNQQIKNGFHLPEDFGRFLDRHRHLIDYRSHLKMWGRVFGRENLVVRVYEKEQLGQGLLADYLGALGLGSDEEFPLGAKPRHNAQLGRDVLEFMNICNSLPLDARERFWLKVAIRKVTNQFDSDAKYLKQAFLSPEQRRELLEGLAEDNRWIARSYLGREDGLLFWEPVDDGGQVAVQPGLSLEGAVKLIMKLFVQGDRGELARLRNGNGKGGRLARLVGPIKAGYCRATEEKLWNRHLWG